MVENVLKEVTLGRSVCPDGYGESHQASQKEVKTMKRIAFGILLMTLMVPSLALADSILFDLNTIPTGTAAPFSSTVSGLTATFTGTALAACNITGLNFAFQSGIAAITSFCVPGAPFNSIGISFNQTLTSI